MRKNSAIPDPVVVPDGWRDASLVDTELFELPPGVTPDELDDREKIHLIYLAALEGDRFVCKPVYIGVGTGEAYGVGPRRRSTQGRYRFYRYDVKDKFHLEYIRRSDRTPVTVQNAQDRPKVTAIDENRAALLLGRGGADGGFMCLSDPKIAEGYAIWLSRNPRNRIVFQEVMLEKVHDDLRTGRPTTAFRADDVAAVLDHAWRTHRLFFVAWQHPLRLSAKEGLDLYYPELPAFRREEYEIYRFKPELLSMVPGRDAEALTIPNVLWSEELRNRLETSVPGAAGMVEQWLLPEVVADLYAYGNHPELRLCTAVAPWRRLSDGGLWDAAVEAAYRGRLFDIDFSPERLCSQPEDGEW